MSPSRSLQINVDFFTAGFTLFYTLEASRSRQFVLRNSNQLLGNLSNLHVSHTLLPNSLQHNTKNMDSMHKNTIIFHQILPRRRTGAALRIKRRRLLSFHRRNPSNSSPVGTTTEMRRELRGTRNAKFRNYGGTFHKIDTKHHTSFSPEIFLTVAC